MRCARVVCVEEAAMAELFAGRVLLSAGDEDDDDDDAAGGGRREVDAEAALRNRVVALHFSALRSPCCRDFAPALDAFCESLLRTRRRPPAPFALVLVSADDSEVDMRAAVRGGHRDWLAVPWDDPLRLELRERYGVTSLPRLVIVRENGAVITARGRTQVRDWGSRAFQGWLNASEVFHNFPES
ncbi:nucleoredoxin-like protein 2 isoform X1 [Lethenteron reissneri]|uniref:nucleoredoxin-like protein 2 isoform X1 n=2 Tax=Lethenteron reissneri TaxID=7753 RepID=UPI002AB72C97|nr:nucleoredoxin-like protein 2 isoform X1 [Lethenteron reissneri]